MSDPSDDDVVLFEPEDGDDDGPLSPTSPHDDDDDDDEDDEDDDDLSDAERSFHDEEELEDEVENARQRSQETPEPTPAEAHPPGAPNKAAAGQAQDDDGRPEDEDGEEEEEEEMDEEPEFDLVTVLEDPQAPDDFAYQMDPALTDFLCRQEIALNLLELYLLTPVPGATDDAAAKHSRTAYELLSRGVPQMMDVLSSSDRCLQLLLSPAFGTLSSVQTDRFCDVFTQVLQHDRSAVEKHAMGRSGLLNSFASHLACVSMVDLLVLLVVAEEEDPWASVTAASSDLDSLDQSRSHHSHLMDWAVRESLVDALLDALRLKEGRDASFHANAASALSRIVCHYGSLLPTPRSLQALVSMSLVEDLLDRARDNGKDGLGNSGFLGSLSVLTDLVEVYAEHHPDLFDDLYGGAIKLRLGSLLDVLNQPLRTLSYSRSSTPRYAVGFLRVQIAELLRALLRCHSSAVFGDFCSLRAFAPLFRIFFEAPLCNIFQNIVSEIVHLVLVEADDTNLRCEMLTSQGLLDQLILLWDRRSTGDRAAFTGHAIVIAQSIRNAVEMHSDVRVVVEQHPGWAAFVSDDLCPAVDRQKPSEDLRPRTRKNRKRPTKIATELRLPTSLGNSAGPPIPEEIAEDGGGGDDADDQDGDDLLDLSVPDSPGYDDDDGQDRLLDDHEGEDDYDADADDDGDDGEDDDDDDDEETDPSSGGQPATDDYGDDEEEVEVRPIVPSGPAEDKQQAEWVNQLAEGKLDHTIDTLTPPEERRFLAQPGSPSRPRPSSGSGNAQMLGLSLRPPSRPTRPGSGLRPASGKRGEAAPAPAGPFGTALLAKLWVTTRAVIFYKSLNRKTILRALNHAVAEGNIGSVRSIIARIADLHERYGQDGWTGSLFTDGWTPLHVAAKYGDPQIMQLLLQFAERYGMLDTDVADPSGRTPLSIACEYSFPCAAMLLSKGAATYLVDARGDTPLHKAVLSNNKNVVALLVQTMTVPERHITNKQGKRPIDLCGDRDHIRELLVGDDAAPAGSTDANTESDSSTSAISAPAAQPAPPLTESQLCVIL